MTELDLKKQTVFTFVILCPIFLVYSFLSSKWYDGYKQDFGAYWQAGHMLLAGQDVYDSTQWEAVRQDEGIVIWTGQTFPYPFPLALLFCLLALLPLPSAYILWIFLAQVAVLTSITILRSFYPSGSGYLGLLAIAGIFFFRPMFSLLNSGQITPFLLLSLAISIRMFRDGKWFAGGSILSILSFKPSVGFPILILTGIWLIVSKQWKGIWGIAAGSLAFALMGALVNPRWIMDYLRVSESSFRRYFGMQPNLWGVVDKIFKIDDVTLIVSSLCIAVVLGIETYLFWRDRSRVAPFEAFANIVPAALLIAPYAWNYDQVLLAISILYLFIIISIKYGMGKAALFMLGIVALAFCLVAVAYQLGHDVWSFMNSFVVWVLVLYFAAKTNPLPGEEDLIPNTR